MARNPGQTRMWQYISFSLLPFALFLLTFLMSCGTRTNVVRTSWPAAIGQRDGTVTEVVGEMEIMITDFLPTPILTVGAERYALQFMRSCEIVPPDLKAGESAVILQAGTYRVRGYTGKTLDSLPLGNPRVIEVIYWEKLDALWPEGEGVAYPIKNDD